MAQTSNQLRGRVFTQKGVRRALQGTLLLVLTLLPTVAAQSAMENSQTDSRPSLILSPGREFAASSPVHAPLPAQSQLLPQSAAYGKDLERQVQQYGVWVNIDQYTPPVYIVGKDTPTVHVKAARSYDRGWSFPPLDQLWSEVPVPSNFAPAPGTDKEAILYQPSTGRYWEFWGLAPSTAPPGDTGPRWQAAWGGRIDRLGENSGYFPIGPDGARYGVAATGLVLLAGLMTIAEQQRGEIDHVLHISLPESRARVWNHPAQSTDGKRKDPDAIPQGTLFRLPASLDLEAIDMDPYARMIARAVQRYGMLVRDTSGAVTFYAENPMTKGGKGNPYYGDGGILRCPGGKMQPSCFPDGNNRLRGFPWNHLQAVQPDGR